MMWKLSWEHRYITLVKIMKNILCFIASLIFIVSCGGDNVETKEQIKVRDIPGEYGFRCELHNSLGTNAVYVNEVVSAICSAYSSEYLNLDNLRFFKNIEILRLGGNSSYIGNIDVLANLKKLKTLSLMGYYEADPTIWAQFHLDELILSGGDLGTPEMPPIHDLKSLHKLYLGTGLSVSLSELSNLEELEINSSVIDGNYISYLENLKKLTLTSSHSHISSGQMVLRGSISGLPNIREIDIQDLLETDFNFIGDLDTLEKLSISFSGENLTTSIDTLKCGEKLTELVIQGSGPEIFPLDITCKGIIVLRWH